MDEVSAAKRDVAKLARASTTGLLGATQAASALQLSTKLASNRLAALARAGWLRRIRRGLYAIVPMESERFAAIEDPWLLAKHLFGDYYVGGWSAAEHWGLTDQLFRSTFIVTASHVRQTLVEVAGSSFRIARVGQHRIVGTVSEWRGRERVAVASRDRTVADALLSPSWVGGIRHLAEIMLAYRKDREFDRDKLIAEVSRFERGSGFKRLGFLAERVWPDEIDVVQCALERRSTGVIKLDPTIATRGRLNKRWGLWINASIDGGRG